MSISRTMKKAKNFFADSDYRFMILSSKGYYDKLSDEDYIKREFKANMGYELPLSNPRTFNEKLQWIKLNIRDDRYSMLVDKCLVKDYISKLIGSEYVIPTIQVWDSVKEFDLDALPNQFVVKCTHNSGKGMSICKDKSSVNKKKLITKLEHGLKEDYYKLHREWPYKNVQHRILVEQYMEDEETKELRDYKFLTFNGVPRIMFIATDRQSKTSTKFDYYDMRGNHLDLKWVYPNADETPKIPVRFNEMIELAQIISKGTIHSRIDFYEINRKVYFGEITFFHQSGLARTFPNHWDRQLGEYINLNA